MPFGSALNSLWEIITSPFSLQGVTLTPHPPSTSSSIPTPPLEDKHMERDTTKDEFLSVNCPLLSNLSAAASMPGACHPDPLALSTSSIGCPDYGASPPFISTSPSPLSRCEEVEFGDSGFAGYSTSEKSPACASSLPSPYGQDGPAEPVITSRRSPTSSLPERSGLASFTLANNGNFSTPSSSDRDRSAESAAAGGYSTSPSLGFSGLGYSTPSTNSSYSSPAASSFSFSLPSPPSSSPPPSAPLSGLSAGPAVPADLLTTQDNNIQPSPKQECKFDTKVVNMPEPPSSNPVLSESIQSSALGKDTRRRSLSPDWEILRVLCNTDVTDAQLESESRIIGQNRKRSYARKRALELEAGVGVCPALDATPTKPSRIPVLQKTRFSAKSSDSNNTAEAATTRGNTGTGVPAKIRPRAYPPRMATQAESSTPPPPPPHPDPITPAKLETPGSGGLKSLSQTCWCRGGVQDGDAATGPKHKKLKMSSVNPLKKASKRKPRKVANSGKAARRTKAVLGPSNGQPPSYLPRPMKPRNLSVSTGELAGGYQAAPIPGTQPVKGAWATPLAKATSSRKRTSENAIVKNAVAKRPILRCFLGRTVSEDESRLSSDDEETVKVKPEKWEAESAAPLAAITSTTSSTAPTNKAKLKSPLASILGKRTSPTGAQASDARDIGNKKIKMEHLQEGATSSGKLDEPDEKPRTNPRHRHRNFPIPKKIDHEIPARPPIRRFKYQWYSESSDDWTENEEKEEEETL